MLLFARNILTAAVALCPAMAGADSGGTTLDMSDGLSESRVRCISQMPDGRMAVATTATIEVYDWTRFHTVKLLPEDACPLPAYHGDRQLSLADIARRTGFHSVKYFSAAFKDSFGMTPSEYRGG